MSNIPSQVIDFPMELHESQLDFHRLVTSQIFNPVPGPVSVDRYLYMFVIHANCYSYIFMSGCHS